MNHRTPFAVWTLLLILVLAFERGHGSEETAKDPELELAFRNLGQFFIFGLARSELDEATIAHFRATRPGAFILFRRNFQSNRQTTDLISKIYRFSEEHVGIKPLIAIDQEGGSVYRIPFLPHMPSPWAIGQAGKPELAEAVGFQVGRGLARLGINMNLAPVLDIGSERADTFLGTRVFGSDPNAVSRIGIAFAEGLLKAKVIPVAKHFPGIGPVANDPHQTIVRRTVSKDLVMGRDIVPFRHFTKIFPSGIMLSHLVYPDLDPTLLPATYSQSIVKELLLKQSEYRGLVVTDDLMMEGSQSGHDFEENVVKAFEAGADLIMVSWSRARQKAAVDALRKAVSSKRISIAEIKSRLEKMLAIKKTVSEIKPAAVPDPDKFLLYGNRQYENVIREIMARNLRQQIARLPTASKNLMKSADRIFFTPQQRRFFDAMGPSVLERTEVLTGEPASWAAKLEKGLLFFFVRSKEDFTAVRNLDPTLLKRTFVINQWKPQFQKIPRSNEIQVFMFHPSLFELLGRWIKESGRAAQPRPVAIQSPAEQIPIPHQQETRSTSSVPEPLEFLGPSERPPLPETPPLPPTHLLPALKPGSNPN